MKLKELINNKTLFFDGAMGTMLQMHGMEQGQLPENLNIENPELITDIHKQFVEAGCDILKTNTFGANRFKLEGSNYSVEMVIARAIENAKAAKPKFTALDIGPTGKLLKPLGSVSFDEAYDVFKEMAVCGEKGGVDCVLIETMSDVYEAKAAVLAVKENTSLPVFVTMTFDEKGKLLTGGDIVTAVAIMEGLGVDCIGMNCGLGPVQFKSLFKAMQKYASVPIILNPNAGLPENINGETCYNVDSEEFSDLMAEFAKMGASIIGGCCGTTPDHIKKTVEKAKNIIPSPIRFKENTIITSFNKNVIIGEKPIIIGERINPTGKKLFKQALKCGDINYIVNEGLNQVKSGAHALDVNVGLPEIDEPAMMKTAIFELQTVLNVPLQIDSSSPKVIEEALRIYNGKALVNSVNGKQESMEAIFPLIKKYGGVVVALTLDENGIPDTAEGRLKIAEKIISTAKKYDIYKKNIIVDALTLTISSDPKQAMVTLETLKLLKEKLGVKTILGVSNISFGLPERENINTAFYTLALQSGLDCGIINPMSEGMMKAYYSFNALCGFDEQCKEYIKKFSSEEVNANSSDELYDAIIAGHTDKAFETAEKYLKMSAPLDIINSSLIPALDYVGKGFESGKLFLPQLLVSAEAAKSAFNSIKNHLLKSGVSMEKKAKIILATVKGDIHDIGKNIVKVLLENYEYEVLDLGKDVLPEDIVKTAIEKDVKLVGLSALMTTTVPSMKETILQLREHCQNCKVMVGGAVLTQDYADMIGADFYAKDAMAAVKIAKDLLG